ncbi:MAG: hypothetical protein ACREDZ_09420 [Kiloniellales bacterium]
MTPVKALLALSLLAAFAACGELPRPFAAESRGDNPLLTLDGRAGALVLPFDHLPPGTTRAAAEAARSALAGALVAEGLPSVTSGGNRESLLVAGTVELRGKGSGKSEEVVALWRLLDTNGRALIQAEQRRALPAGSWSRKADEILTELAAEAAPELAARALGPAESPAAIPGYPDARLVLLPPDPAPGDSADSLPKALAEKLAEAGVPLGRKIEKRDLLLRGKIRLEPAGSTLDQVTLQWVLVRASDGAELGEVSQQTLVPAGSLNGRWGESAHEAALGAADGLLELIRELPLRPRGTAGRNASNKV